jgi:hypothetical protein
VFEHANRIIDFISFYIQKRTLPKDVDASVAPQNLAFLYFYGLGGENTITNLAK